MRNDDKGASEKTGRTRNWYDMAPGDTRPLDFAALYRVCEGTILGPQDCGRSSCRTAACCSSTRPDSFIFFLPGEIEFQRRQHPPIPFLSVSVDHADRLHCRGNQACVYRRRPLDCRSYPYFPAVLDRKHIGYYDCRKSHDCPLRPELELRHHLRRIHKWWVPLLSRTDLLIWAEQYASHLQDFPLLDFPSGEDRR